MYFPDLSPYVYDRGEPRADVLNVGWLSADQPFPTGFPDNRLLLALERLIACPVNLYRGKHLCEFCPKPPLKIIANRLPMIDPPPDTTGNGEIRVLDSSGITYVAP